MFGNQIRFTGMSSGMDTQSIVQQLMRAESMRMDRLTRRRQLATWRQEQYRGIATDLRLFRDTNLSMAGNVNNIMRVSTFRAWETALTTTGNVAQNGITVTATSNARAGSFDVWVQQVATNTTARGRLVDPTDDISGSTKLSSLTAPGIHPLPTPNPALTPQPTANTTPPGSHFRRWVTVEEASKMGWTLTAPGHSSVQPGGLVEVTLSATYVQAKWDGFDGTSGTGDDIFSVIINNEEVYYFRDSSGSNNYYRLHRDMGDGTFSLHPTVTDPLNFHIIPTSSPATDVMVNKQVYFEHNDAFHEVERFNDGTHNFLFIEHAPGNFIMLEENAGVLSVSSSPLPVTPPSSPDPDRTNHMVSENVTFTLGGETADVKTVGGGIFFAVINDVKRHLESDGHGGYKLVTDNPLRFFDESEVHEVRTSYELTQVFKEAATTIRTDSNAPIDSSVASWWADDPTNTAWRSTDDNGKFFSSVTAVTATLGGVQGGAPVFRFTDGGNTQEFVIMDSKAYLVERNASTGVFELVSYSSASGTVDHGGYAGFASIPTGAQPVTDFVHTQRFESTITINNVEINIYSDYSIDDVMAAINRSAAGVEMTLENGQFSLTSKTAGAASGINITRDDSGFMEWAMFLQADLGINAGRLDAGQDAKVWVREPGSGSAGWQELAFNSDRPNTFTHNGHTISLTGAVGTADSDYFTVTTTRDVEGGTDRVVSAIRDFVDQYNALVLMLQNAHSTARPRTNTRTFYEPLTDEQRRNMSDREIERWEEQAQKGLLHRDSAIRDIQARMRRQINDGVMLPDGTRIFLHQIGVTADGTMPGQAAHQRNIGLLRIDEERLRTAIEGSPELVEGLFTAAEPFGAEAAGLTQQQLYERTGLGNRLRTIINDVTGATGALSRMAGVDDVNHHNSRLSREIRDFDRRIERMHDWLVRRENQLFAMFSRMEVAMAKANQQMDSLWMFGMN